MGTRIMLCFRSGLPVVLLNAAATIILFGVTSFSFKTVAAVSDDKTPVTIIMYHSINANKRGDYAISPGQFENDIMYLKDNGYSFITLTDLINYVNKWYARLPDKPVIITFDDGYYNNYLYAYPIMQKYDARFVISVLGIFTDMNKEDERMNELYTHLTWEQIKEMDKSGLVEIQNHTYNMHSYDKGRAGSKKKADESYEAYKQALTDDVMKLQALLKEHADTEPNAFVYPFGKVSPESVEILKELGFKAALTVSEGINYIGKGDGDLLFRLKRFNRPHGKSSESFFKGKLE